MLIFLYGQDGYRLKQDLNILITSYRAKNPESLSFAVLDLAEKENFTKLEDSIKTVSFFGEKRLLILKNAFEKAEEISGLINSWNLTEDKERILVFVENLAQGEVTKKGRKLFKILTSKPNITKVFEPLTSKRLENWVIKIVRELDGQIEVDALKKLIYYIGNDTWRLNCELNKLVNYKFKCQDKNIKLEDVNLLVTAKTELKIFDAIDAIGNKNKPKSFLLLSKHIESGEDPNYIFSMIVYQFRNLIKIKSLAMGHLQPSEISQRAGLHPFVVGKAIEQAKKFDMRELKDKFTELAEADIRFKSGIMDMEDFIFKFAIS